jgi:TetR/AcrR family transcriptional regulator
MPQPARQNGTRAESTRASILDAAERLFAERGFDKARLEDVAEAVGIRRASIVYYFKDKRELYDAVLDGVFGDFHVALEAELAAEGTLVDRIEAAVGAWVDYVGARPTFARILLREVAAGGTGEPTAALAHVAPFVGLVETFLAKHAGDELMRRMPIDPAHIAATIAGATVFFVAAMPTLVPDITFDPLSPEHLDAHRTEVLRITRRLIGTDDQ